MKHIYLLFVFTIGIFVDQAVAKQVDDTWTTSFAVEPEEWSSTGSNPYFILKPGYQLILEGGNERLVVTILDEVKTVDGVETRVLEERETKDGQLVEVSRNYFAISKQTNSVFYFGEDVDVYKDGQVASHEGGWLAGEKDAKFGLMMPGQVLLKAKYYQEIAPQVAMDRAEIVGMNETVETPAGAFKNCLKVEETTPLEPGEKEYKLYAPGIGLIQDGSLNLVSWSKKEESSGQTLSLSDLPAVVRATIERLIAGGEIKLLEKEEADGKVIYDVEARVKDKDVEYDIADDGTVLTSEESVPYSSLPEAVRAAAEKYFGSTAGLKASRELESGNTFYEVEGMKGGVAKALKLNESGEIVEEE